MTDSLPLVGAAAALLLVGLLTWLGTWMVRRYALTRGLLDYPGHRSSHSLPTPRGGGFAIAVVLLGAIALQAVSGSLPGPIGVAILGGGILVALVGWIDDHRNLSAAWRAGTHFLAAVWAVGWLGAPESISLGVAAVSLGPAAPIVAVVALVWLTNLFNFMDGIDGIAAVEAVWVGTIAGAMLLWAGNAGLAMTSLMVAAASTGFLAWNWPPAKIFMGDVGSGLLGFMFGALALATSATGSMTPAVWLLLMGLFVFDATVTLVRRIGRERLYEPHRRHGYQRAVQAGLPHRHVTMAVLLLNVTLGILAAAAWAAPEYIPLILLIAGSLLTVTYRRVECWRPMWSDTIAAGDEGEKGRPSSG